MDIAKLNKKIFYTRIITYNMLLLLMLSLTAYFIFGYKIHNFKKIIEKEEHNKLISVKSIILNSINEFKTETLILSKMENVKILFKNNKKEKLRNSLSQIMYERRYYDFIKFIDLSGQEKLCMGYNNRTSKISDSTGKHSVTKYFNTLREPEKNQIFVTFKGTASGKEIIPTLKLLTPVINNSTKVGYISIGFNISHLNKRLSYFFKNTPYRFHILTQNGKFIFYNSSAETLKQVNSSPYKHAVFKRVILDNNGFFSYNNALFYRKNIKINLGCNTLNLILAAEYPEKALLPIKEKEFQKVLKDTFWIYIVSAVLLTIIILILSKLSVSKMQSRIFGKLIEQSSESIAITDLEGNIIYTNNSFLSLFRTTRKQTTNSNIKNFYSEFHDNDFYSYMWKKIKISGFWEGEIISNSNDGEKIYSNLKINKIEIKKTNQVFLFWSFSNLTDTKYAKIEILKSQLYDACTGLPNRVYINKYLTKLIKNKTQFGLLSIKINNLSKINRSYGFDTGDIILVMLTEKLKKIWGEDVFEGRLNENTLVVSIEHSNLDNLENKLKKILSLSNSPFSLFSKNIFLDIDMGIVFYPEAGDTTDKILKSLCKNTQTIKDNKENFFKYFSKKTKELELKRQEMLDCLKNASVNNEFSLAYQQKINISTGEFVGAETLLRWNNKKLGSISPALFIPLAEQSGCINKITEWTINKLCEQLKKWKNKFSRSFPVSINISFLEFKDKKFADNFINTLNNYGLHGDDVIIEITENALNTNFDISFTLDKLKEHNFKIHIDNFGTGSSSLGYLKKLNIDALKIDREFIKNYPVKDDGGLAKIITDTAKTLKLEVIAEGVETEQQVSFLRRIGCNVVQGYYFSKPLTSDKFEEYLKKNIS
ncbi:MAG: EAL domain-containing protein [Victivallales bacterium]|nr:EAL domain-containing protein [Victivallales bacterium]